MKLSELVDDIQLKTHTESTDLYITETVIEEMINRYYQLVNDNVVKIEEGFFEEADPDTANLTNGVKLYVKPTSCLKLLKVLVKYETEYQLSRRYDIRDADYDINNEFGKNYPRYRDLPEPNNKIELNPTPDAPITSGLKQFYLKRPSALTHVGDEATVLPTEGDKVIVAYVCGEIESLKRNDKQESKWRNLARTMLREWFDNLKPVNLQVSPKSRFKWQKII